MSGPRIRPLALCVFRDGDSIYISESRDSVKDETFLRPLGGGIEFGEKAEVAVIREIREELGAEIRGLKRLGVLENLFVFAGKPGHEIVFVFEAEFVDPKFLERVDRPIYERGELASIAKWKPVEEVLSGSAPLYPDGFPEILREWMRKKERRT